MMMTDYGKRESLFLKMDNLVREDKLYLSNDINIVEVAARLATNRTYLLSALHSQSLDFRNYINKLRIEELISIINGYSNIDQDYNSVEDVALSLGFKNSIALRRAVTKFMSLDYYTLLSILKLG